MSAEKKNKNNKSFWIAFTALLLLAAIATIGNLMEYRKMDKLETEGKRVMCTVDSIAKKGSKEEIYMHLMVGDKTYIVSKKVKESIAIGDSVAVYYMPDNPSVNGVVAE